MKKRKRKKKKKKKKKRFIGLTKKVPLKIEGLNIQCQSICLTKHMKKQTNI